MKRFIAAAIALACAAFCATSFAATPHASIYVADGSTSQAITTTPAKMTGFATAGEATSEDGDLSLEATVASDQIDCNAAGRYLVVCTISGEADAADETVQAVLRQDTTEVASGQCISESETANEPFSMGFTTVVQVTAAQIESGSGDVAFSIYLESSGSVAFTPTHAQLTVVRLDGP